jgi:hypothetical protein
MILTRRCTELIMHIMLARRLPHRGVRLRANGRGRPSSVNCIRYGPSAEPSTQMLRRQCTVTGKLDRYGLLTTSVHHPAVPLDSLTDGIQLTLVDKTQETDRRCPPPAVVLCLLRARLSTCSIACGTSSRAARGLCTTGPRSRDRENLPLSSPALIPHFEMRIDKQRPSKERLEAIWDWMNPCGSLQRTSGSNWDYFRFICSFANVPHAYA